jgi:hypothetical protein
MNIINFYPNHKVFAHNITTQVIIVLLNKHLDLIELTVKDIERYHSMITEKVKVLSEKKKLPDEPQNHLFVGTYNHQVNLNRRLEFLDFLIMTSNNKL